MCLNMKSLVACPLGWFFGHMGNSDSNKFTHRELAFINLPSALITPYTTGRFISTISQEFLLFNVVTSYIFVALICVFWYNDCVKGVGAFHTWNFTRASSFVKKIPNNIRVFLVLGGNVWLKKCIMQVLCQIMNVRRLAGIAFMLVRPSVRAGI